MVLFKDFETFFVNRIKERSNVDLIGKKNAKRLKWDKTH